MSGRHLWRTRTLSAAQGRRSSIPSGSRSPRSAACAGALLLSFMMWGMAPHEVRASPPDSPADIVYEDVARTMQTRISTSAWTIGPIVPEKSLPSWSSSHPMPEQLVHPTVDCSDSTFLCVRTWAYTLAIPRDGLKPGGRYVKEEVVFHVEECLRADHNRCQVALIGASCGTFHMGDTGGSCKASPKPLYPGAKVGYVVYFFFNEDYGITAMGVAERIASSSASRRQIATQQILVGDRGLFGPP
jgi:hypothetical protein